MPQREPSIVTEARAATRQSNIWSAVSVAVMMFGWLPMLIIDQLASGDSTAATVAMVAYLAATVVSIAAIMWKSNQTAWARRIMSSWNRTQADSELRQAQRQEGIAPDEVPASVLMARIREHLEFDARALRAAEEAHERLQTLHREERSAAEAIRELPDGDGRNQLTRARQALLDEASEIEGTLAALYATLLTRESQPTYSGLKNTLLELEAEVEVDQSQRSRAARRESL